MNNLNNRNKQPQILLTNQQVFPSHQVRVSRTLVYKRKLATHCTIKNTNKLGENKENSCRVRFHLENRSDSILHALSPLL